MKKLNTFIDILIAVLLAAILGVLCASCSTYGHLHSVVQGDDWKVELRTAERGGPMFRDMEESIRVIHCALVREYGFEVAKDIMNGLAIVVYPSTMHATPEDPDGLAGLYHPYTTTIDLRWFDSSALDDRKSALLHEIYQHRRVGIVFPIMHKMCREGCSQTCESAKVVSELECLLVCNSECPKVQYWNAKHDPEWHQRHSYGFLRACNIELEHPWDGKD